jgi:demethylmenaquinone methyltransferase/2-methoxy-6-polyprenyl-1,4-benzoquinol methylase
MASLAALPSIIRAHRGSSSRSALGCAPAVSQTPHTRLAPHPPLRDYYAREEDRHAWVLGLFNRTACDYDRVERVMALGSGSRYRRRALQAAGLRSGMRVFDVGVGTGLVAREAAAICGDPTGVTGVDPSPGMVENAKVPPGVRLVAGSAESIPAGDGEADFLCMGYALRHVADLSAAFCEFYRVLKPAGRLCLLEITCPDHPWSQTLLKFYMRVMVPVAARLVARHRDTPELMRYYWDTIEACAPPQVIQSALATAGFVEVTRHVALGIFSEYRALKPAVAACVSEAPAGAV